ncbi:MAG: HAD family hydrolase [Gemmatimonadaceae bacterium]
MTQKAQRHTTSDTHGVRAVLLDIDGTLIDSNDAHAEAWVAALSEAGFDVPFGKVRPLIGMGADKLLPMITGIESDTRKGKSIAQRRGEIFRNEYLPGLKPFQSARDLLLRMRQDGLKLVTATSSGDADVEGLLQAANVNDLIEAQTTASDASNSKPDPDIIEAALSRSGEPPGRAIMLGDTPYDVAAAKRAGVRSIALRCGGWLDAELAGAIAVYDDVADLLARYEKSPLAKH